MKNTTIVQSRTHFGLVQVLIQTIGTLHPGAIGELPPRALFFDLGGRLRNPHSDPRMRYRTGLDAEVRSHVLSTPGANDVINEIFHSTTAQLYGYAESRGRLVRVMVACRGGRHRSVAIADQVAEYLAAEGIGVEVEHLHVTLPVVQP